MVCPDIDDKALEILKMKKNLRVIIYNQDFSSSSSGERSRFINQLIYELKPLSSSNISIREYVSLEKFRVEKNSEQVAPKIKDDYIINKLFHMCDNGFSPSTINMYNYCKRQFYFEKIKGQYYQ